MDRTELCHGIALASGYLVLCLCVEDIDSWIIPLMWLLIVFCQIDQNKSNLAD